MKGHTYTENIYSLCLPRSLRFNLFDNDFAIFFSNERAKAVLVVSE